jgi:hypothetical protein
VAAGTYSERITLRPRTYLYGGFNGGEQGRDERDWSKQLSILDGVLLGTVVTASNTGYRLCGIDGMVVQRGGTSTGGILCSYGSPVITHNTVSANTTGGILCSQSCPLIIENTIAGNSTTGSGSAIRVDNSLPLIARNIIRSNSGSAAIYCSSASRGVLPERIAAHLEQRDLWEFGEWCVLHIFIGPHRVQQYDCCKHGNERWGALFFFFFAGRIELHYRV